MGPDTKFDKTAALGFVAAYVGVLAKAAFSSDPIHEVKDGIYKAVASVGQSEILDALNKK